MSRIAIILPSLRGGGAERVMVTLAKGFVAQGIKVDMVLVKKEGPYLKDVGDSIRIVDLKSSRALFCLPKLILYLREHRPDTVLSALSHVNVITLIARMLSRVSTRIVVSEHNNFSASNLNALFLRTRCMIYLMRFFYPHANTVVAVSRGVADDLAAALHVPKKSIQVVYNPIVTPAVVQGSLEPLDHPWFDSGEPPVILGVGRFVLQKDFPLLIRAFARVRAQRETRLMILGEGVLRSELEALVQELDLKKDILLPGFIANPYAYMRRAGLFVLSSRWEGFGNVLVEAMVCGTPVVSTDCPSGPSEILENGKWGRLVPVGDVDAMAAAINAALVDPVRHDVARRAADFGLDGAVASYKRVLF